MKRESFVWWGCAALITSSWVFLAPFYHVPLLGPGIACVLGAILVAALAFEKRVLSYWGSWYAAVAVSVATAWIYPFATLGARISLIVLSLGLLGLRLHVKGIRRLSAAVTLVGLVSSLQAGVVALYAAFLSDKHFALLLTYFDYWLPRLFGVRTAVIGQQVFFPAGTGLTKVIPTWDQLALVYGLVACVAGVALVALGCTSSRRGGVFFRCFGLTGAYLVVRRLLLLLFVLDGASLSSFWNPTLSFLTLLPLFFFLWLFCDVNPSLLTARLSTVLRAPTLRKSSVTLVLTAMGTASVVFSLLLVIPGVKNGDAVWFDEGHGDWESTLTVMDKEWYGKQSTYNYHSLYDWLSYYYDVDRVREPITEGSLDACDILVIKIPSKPYTEIEIEAVARFVRRGGGLFVIGDHTNVFGSTSSLNPLLRAFDLALNYDSTYDLRTGQFTSYTPPGRTLSPVMQYVDRFQFLTSCTIQAPVWAWRPIIDTAIITTQVDYSTKDFFATERRSLASTYGALTQAAAVPYGLGRVLVFTDSTCFSNFSLHMDGYPRFILGALGFLGRQNLRFPLRTLLGAIGVCCFLAAFACSARKRPASHTLFVIAGLALGLAASSVACLTVHHSAYPLPESKREVPYVYFDTHHSASVISPTPAASSTNTRYRFDTFFVWTQRVAQVPVLLYEPTPLSLDPARPYVMINPRGNLDRPFLAELRTYVEERGGKLLLMDSKHRDLAGLSSILEHFDLRAELQYDSKLVLAGNDVEVVDLGPSSAAAVSLARKGEGMVVLATDSALFSDEYLGGSFTLPSQAQQVLYDLEFFLFEDLLNRQASPPA